MNSESTPFFFLELTTRNHRFYESAQLHWQWLPPWVKRWSKVLLSTRWDPALGWHSVNEISGCIIERSCSITKRLRQTNVMRFAEQKKHHVWELHRKLSLNFWALRAFTNVEFERTLIASPLTQLRQSHLKHNGCSCIASVDETSL